MPAKLYVVHGSHPCATVQRALEMKAGSLQGRRAAAADARGRCSACASGRARCPALTLETARRSRARGRSCAAWRSSRPSPRCFPADPDARVAVERAEEWGDEVWQPMARRLLWRAFAIAPAGDDELPGGLALPAARAGRARAGPLVNAGRAPAQRRRRGRRARRPRARCRATWTASTPGSPTACWAARRPNAADLQIATTSRLMLTIGDVRRSSPGARPRRTRWSCSVSGPAPPRRACSRRSGCRPRRAQAAWRAPSRTKPRMARRAPRARPR